MRLVPAKCKQCDGILEVNRMDETAKCSFCGTTFFIEDVVNYYNTFMNNKVNAGNTFIMFEEYQSAEKIFRKLSEEYPQDYRGWWGLIKVKTKNFTEYLDNISDWNEINKWYERVHMVSNGENLSNIDLIFHKYISYLEGYYNKLVFDYEEANTLEEKYKQQINDLQTQINILDEKIEVETKECKKEQNQVSIVGIVIILVITATCSIIAKATIGKTILALIIIGAIVGFFCECINNLIKSELDETVNKLKQTKETYLAQLSLFEQEYNKQKLIIDGKYSWLHGLRNFK